MASGVIKADLSKIAGNLVKNASSGEVCDNPASRLKGSVPPSAFEFSSAFCRLGARDLSVIHPQLKAHNVRLIGIGLEQLGVEEFLEKRFFSGELYVDEKKKNYADLGYKRHGYFSILTALISRAARAMISRVKQEGVEGNFAGDGLQTGGTLIVERGGKVLLDFKQDNPADHVEPAKILEILGIKSEAPSS
ncbi:unnamed protein product [Notodromas monacha]|uniref:Prostamide/prostaglandin F synthase n=1 Tax=Notodromas monacha TaxID=399045 RepID=A0A7R9GH45_9CRUS|nr:unnamed protein product [Notodromas monacha]CAG0922505.1 unnamed protein product [Notodromas monacha]